MTDTVTEDWAARTDLPPVQREACAWLERHGIDPHLVPCRDGSVTFDEGTVTAQQYWEGENGRREADITGRRARLTEPVTREIVEPPSDDVRSWFGTGGVE